MRGSYAQHESLAFRLEKFQQHQEEQLSALKALELSADYIFLIFILVFL